MSPIEPSPKPCPRCGMIYPSDAPEGLCPRCLGALNFTGETGFTDARPERKAPPSPDELAPHFPQLEILECLGRGGMGVVYKARQKSLGRFVALKLLAPERETDAEFAGRFAQEAQALAALSHPHIVTIHDFGRSDNSYFFLIMEYVDGVNLRQLLHARRLTPEEALAIVPPLCDALQFAHGRGIVHCDIKPENLLLDKHGRVKVADFGVAKILGNDATRAAEAKIAGTPGYMAPEQSENPQAVDSRADIYSLGVVFYEMLTGELPGDKLQPPSRKVAIDVRIDEVVLRAMEKAPAMRWQTVAEIRSQVETITADAAVRGSTARSSEAAAAKRSQPGNGQWSRSVRAIVLALAVIFVLFLAGLLIPAILAAQARRGQAATPTIGAEKAGSQAASVAQSEFATVKVFAASDLRKLPEAATDALNFQVTGPADAPVVSVTHEGAGPLGVEILTCEAPKIDSLFYVLTGEVRYEHVEGNGYLEMWSHFASGAYFSRTLGLAGPMAALRGDSDWRVFSLPFDATGAEGGPKKLVFNVQLPGKGSVGLRNLKLVQRRKGG